MGTKKYDFEVLDVDPEDYREKLNIMGSLGWDYCQTLVNQNIVENKIAGSRKMVIKYLLIMKREVIV
jgi:hypothetical protein